MLKLCEWLLFAEWKLLVELREANLKCVRSLREPMCKLLSLRPCEEHLLPTAELGRGVLCTSLSIQRQVHQVQTNLRERAAR